MVCDPSRLSRIIANEWSRDQELRFTVHDSADYYNLKVSVFNDDRRTDLIGETWINLEAVVIPGGGQGDSWHSLSCKGRYAGEIRIELTYYDIRPKIEKPRENGRERKQSESDTSAPAQNAHMAVPKQLPPVRRRPLPPGPMQSLPSFLMNSEHHSTASLPQLVPQSYHSPPRHDYPDTFSEGSEHTQYGSIHQSAMSSAAAYPRSLPNSPLVPRDIYYSGSGSIAPLRTQRSHGFNTSSPYNTGDHNDHIQSHKRVFAEPDPVDDYMEYTDDPYALEVVDAGQDHIHEYETSTDIRRLRNNRVQTLSSTPHYRPPIHHAGLPHTRSAPILSLHEQQGVSQSHTYDHDMQIGESYDSSPSQDASFRNLSHQSPVYKPSLGALPKSTHFGRPTNHEAPPPPPIHSNSAPIVPGLARPPPPSGYYMPQPGQPQHVPSIVHGLPLSPNHTQQHSPHQRRYPHTALFQPQPGLALSTPRSHFPPERRRSEDPNMSSFQDPRALAQQSATAGHEYYTLVGSTNAPSDPRRNIGSIPSRRHQNLDAYPVQLRPQPESHLEYGTSSEQHLNMQGHSPRGTAPRVSPRAVSPNCQPQQTPPNFTNSARKSVSPQPANRHTDVPFSPDSYSSLNPHTARTPPTATTTREPSPMYISPPSIAPTPPQQQHDLPQLVADGPIIGTDGRLIDPSDHLPLSSYAPEPERKNANRPSAAVIVKTRFGPRDAHPTPLTNPSSPTSNWTARASEPAVATDRNPRPSRSSGGAHSPLAPSPGNTLDAQYPPPVPRKFPISPMYSSGFGGGVEDYEPGGSMAALSQEIAGIDIGPGRSRITRRSRFGA